MNIDVAIIVGFFVVTLIVGLSHGQRIKNIRDYALGNRNFSTSALVATTISTWIGGGFFFTVLSKSYSDGLYFLFAASGMVVSFLIVAIVLVPKMEEFIGKTSIAEAMGDLYGKNVQIITAFAGIIGDIGALAVQFKAFGDIFVYFFEIPSYIAVVASGSVVIIYSALGGIRAVTYTDILQLAAFSIAIPLVGVMIWDQLHLSGFEFVYSLNSIKFNYKEVFSFSNTSFLQMIPLMLYFAIPSLKPALCQRIVMGQSVKQVRKAFLIAGALLIFMLIATSWIAFLIFNVNADLRSDQLLGFILDNYTYWGLKELILISVIAMAMSTADSILHVNSTLFSNDICTPLKIGVKKELILSKIFSVLLGVIAIILAILTQDYLSILLIASSFYMPVVTAPLIVSILGFRSTTKSIIIGMVAGFITIILWKLANIKMNGIVIATTVNLVFFLGSHYFLKQPGGWITGVKQKRMINNWKSLKSSFRKIIYNFNFLNFVKKNFSISEFGYVQLGIYFIIYTFTAMYSLQVESLYRNKTILTIYQIMISCGVILSMYPILFPNKEKKELIFQVIWPIAVFFVLIFFNSFFVMLNSFSSLQLAVFTINIILAIMLVGWKLGLAMITLGFYFSACFYKYYVGIENIDISLGSPQFIIMYILSILVAVTIIFLKPKQEQQEATKAKVDTLEEEVADLNEKVVHYTERVEDQGKEIERLGATAQRILNNVNHELRLPVGNVMNFAEMLNDGLGKLNEKQLKMLSDEVYQNSNRLSSMIMNMLDLATLEAKKIELNKSTINFGELVRDRVQSCRKMYLGDKKIDFEMQIEEDVLIKVDPNYMRQTVDNLVINAISFSQEGIIRISVLRKGQGVEFMISDNGIGIPKEELYDIFTPFKMGSNAESKAEGRGVGLALCKAAIEAHGGSISAESKDGKGAQFQFVLII